MKYYAVTEDPNELLHYGRLGMKWGQHIFVGPKSLAYKKAAGKLRSVARSAKTAIKKSSAQRSINRQKKLENKFNKAVEKTQKRLAIAEKMYNLDRLTNYENKQNRILKNEAFAAKTQEKRERIADKMERKYARNERKMDKYTQEAREGRLRYGKLSEEQVDRITNRLAIEQSARRLGSTEKPKFRKRMKEAVQEGILRGVVEGTAAGMREVAVDKVQNRLRNKHTLDKANRNEAKRQKEATRIKNHRTRKEIREDLKQEAYEAQVESGAGLLERSRVLHPFTNTNAGKMMLQAEQRKKLNSQIQESKLLYDSKGNLTKKGKQIQAIEDRKHQHDLAREEEKFLIEESQNARRNARQDAENERRAERQLEIQGKRAYEYGYLSSGNGGNNNNGGGGKQKKKGTGGGGGSTEPANNAILNYYTQKYVTGKTLQEQKKEREAEAKRNVEVAEQRRELNRIIEDRNKRQAEQDAEAERRKHNREVKAEQRKIARETARQKKEAEREEYQRDIMRQLAEYSQKRAKERETFEPIQILKFDQPTTITSTVDKRVENARKNTSTRRKRNNKKNK